MPPKAVKTVEDLIYWHYAKLMAKSAGHYTIEEQNYRVVMSFFKDLKSGRRKWSDILREDMKVERRCAYCGSFEDLTKDHIIPVKISPPESCKILEVHNIVWACKRCNSLKGDKDIFEWYGLERRNEIPRIVEGKYLKLIYECHSCRGTLDKTDLNLDGRIDVMDLGHIFKTPCPPTPGREAV